MPQFNGRDVFEILNKIGSVSSQIEMIVSGKDQLEADEIKSLRQLYLSRKDHLALIEKWYNSNEGKEYIKNNPDAWNKKINALAEKDKKNIKDIDKHVDIINKELKSLVKQKSLLIYTKR